MDLARELTALREHIDWPPTPELRLELEPRAPYRRRRNRRPLALGLALALVALAAAFAVPQSRGAILRFFHLGGATIVRVDRLPPAGQRPLSAGLGRVVSLDEAKRAFGGTLLLPPADPLPPAHLSGGSVVSFVFSHHGEPVLLNEFAYGTGFLKKFVGGGTSVEPTEVDGSPGFWVSGADHDLFFPGSSPRLAGNALIWEHEGATYRLEGRALTKAEAVSLARSLSGG
jgi:hypothetical protein